MNVGKWHGCTKLKEQTKTAPAAVTARAKTTKGTLMPRQSLEHRSTKTKRSTKQKETRAQRGVALYEDLGEQIQRLAESLYLVPSAKTRETYRADIENQTCNCVDAPRARRLGESCKHLVAAEMKHAELRRSSPTGERRIAEEREAYIESGAYASRAFASWGKLSPAQALAAQQALELEAMKPPALRARAGEVAILAIAEARVPSPAA